MTLLYQGKTKEVYRGPDDDTLRIVYTDTATAFNGEKRAALRGKGRINAAISHQIFRYLEAHGIRTHLLKTPDERSALVLKAEIIGAEVIVRNVAAGSFSKKYGVPEGTALRNTVLEFSLKNDALGDPMINESQLTALGVATPAELAEMSALALQINGLLCDWFAKAGMRLIDYKLEFGRHKGVLLLCDEISPDSCRLWDIHTGERLDKDRFRHDLGDVLGGYTAILGRLQHV